MEQESTASPSSPAPSIGTQPHSQDALASTSSQPPMAQTQPLIQQPPPPLSCLTQAAGDTSQSSQLLVTQPSTQLEIQSLAAAATEQPNARGSSSQCWISQPVTQPITQACGDALTMPDKKTQPNDGDECDLFGDAVGRNDDDCTSMRDDLAEENDAATNPLSVEEESVEALALKDSGENDIRVGHDGERLPASLGAHPPPLPENTGSNNPTTLQSADARTTRENEVPNNQLDRQMRPNLSEKMNPNTTESTTVNSNADIGHMLTPPLQNMATVGRNGVIEGDARSNRDVIQLPVEAPHYARRKVTNPYTKSQKPMSAKRSADEINRCSSSSNKSATEGSNDLVCPNNAASHAAPRKQVFNPYAKAKQTPKHAVRNPYAKLTAAATPIIPATENNTTNDADTAEKERDPSAVAASSNTPQFRRAGVSISLPMADRLPSRNVSYQPAEILTVGELYRYLYGKGKDKEEGSASGVSVAKADSAPTSKELVSVRITGTLLCVSTSQCDENTGAKDTLYDNGTFLLVGDPLENTRFLKKEVPSKESHSNLAAAATPSIPKVNPKTQLTSILRSKKTPAPPSTASVSKTPGSGPMGSDKSTGQASIAATPAATFSDEAVKTDNVASTNKRTNRGILNTNKKKKLVYNGGGKRLSFGERGGGRGRGLRGRKFVTPKRANLAGPVSNATNGLTSRSVSSTLKRGGFYSPNPASAVRNPSPESVIQRHRSPIVPIWIGSFYNGDGLDGSVVGDLVMIMGEIVTEHGTTYQESHNHTDNRFDDEDTKANTTDADETNRKFNEKAARDQLRESLNTPTRIQGVKDAAVSIAACAMKISGVSSVSQSQTTAEITKSMAFCSHCTRFLRARFVRNANGTDMSLYREALITRRKYLKDRKSQMESLMPTSVTDQGLYSVGCGPPI